MNKSQAVCRYFASGGTCFYGNDCQFIHGNPDQHLKQNDSGPLLGDEVFAGYELPAESKLSSYIATRVPKDPMANSMSNLSIQDVTAQEFIPSSNPGSSSSLNNVSNQTMPHTMSSPSFVKSPHMLRDRESPEDSPVIARRSFMRNPSPLTVNGGDYTGMYQESLGGTTYFYQPHEENGAPANEMLPPGPGAHPEAEIIPPTFHAYPGPPTHVDHMKPKANAPSFFMPDDLRLELLNRASILNSRCNADLYPDLPQQIDNYTNICPLETQINKSTCYGLMTSVYKANNVKSGLVYCLRRVHNFRLSSNKAIIEVIDHWKKIQHSNLVQLRELFTTKAFGDNSVVFVYDFFPGAQTLKQTYFATHPSMQGPQGQGGPVGYNGSMNGGKNRGASRMQQDASLRQGHGLLPESLIWTYIVQLSSALRTIHAANLAMRCIDPSKVLLSSAGKSRLRLNCAAIVDLITIDAQQQQQQRTLMPHHQKEDLINLGRLILCLACNNPAAYQYLESSMDCVAKHYSTDLRNLLLLLLGHPLRVTTINDVMPMIGARFYTQLDSAQMRSDVLEAELAKEVENGRLFRLLVKLGAINERPELNMDTTWSETGDRYMLKLFRDYLFHQCTKEGMPWLDMAHVVQCLNKLDAGVDEKICLVSRDEQNVLVVSYAELKRCIEAAFSEVYAKPHSA